MLKNSLGTPVKVSILTNVDFFVRVLHFVQQLNELKKLFTERYSELLFSERNHL